MLNKLLVEDIVKRALIEDMNYGDLTTDNLIDQQQTGEGIITVKENGVIAGLTVAEEVFKILDKDLIFVTLKKDGDEVQKGEEIARVKGKLNSILKGERSALNLLQRMSGIATKARKYIKMVEGYPLRIVDTRKTTPGLRILEKYAVKIGGCYNHRYNLSDGALIKDNHIKAVGSITKAIQKCREAIPHTVKIEIEVENLEQLEEALKAGADIILLDNMDVDTMKKAVEINKGRALLEASGNIREEQLLKLAEIGIDMVSIGGLTHSVAALDISLNIK